MAQGSQIEWCDDTCNPMMGCDGCELWDPKNGVKVCYALLAIEMHTAQGPRKGWPADPMTPTIFPGRVAEYAKLKDLTGTMREKKPWLNGLPRTIFVNDMGDGFTASLPLDWLAPESSIMAPSSHRWLFLTKRPDRQRQFAERHALPNNVWVGTSITKPQDQRMRHLLRTRAAVRFVSYEPVLGRVDWRPWFERGLNWLILGGESGPQARSMSLKALVSTVQQCLDAKVPVFVKQDSAMRPGQQGRIPNDLLIREFPTPREPIR